VCVCVFVCLCARVCVRVCVCVYVCIPVESHLSLDRTKQVTGHRLQT
jgi:hypothetical protein